jgi:hypothetical protein
MMKNSKNLEFPEGREGVRGLESASRILMTGGSLYVRFTDFAPGSVVRRNSIRVKSRIKFGILEKHILRFQVAARHLFGNSQFHSWIGSLVLFQDSEKRISIFSGPG